MAKSVLMAELSWVEYQRRLEKEDAIVLVPVGATEQHGPHLPLGTDAILAGEISRLAALPTRGVVAPTLSYGYKSQPRTGGGDHFPGSAGLDGNNLVMMLSDVLSELGRTGAKRIAVIDGHYENQFFLTEGCELALRRLRTQGITDVTILKMRYAEDITKETLDSIAKFYDGGYPGLALEHAGVMETSMMLHLFPDLVHMDQVPRDPPACFPPYDLYPHDPAWVPSSGVLTPAIKSSPATGKLLVDEFVKLVSSALEAAFRAARKRSARLAL